VIISLSLIKSYQQSGGQNLIYTPFDESQTSNGGTKLWMSIANASIFISVVIVMTIVLILLYKFKCYKIIHGWLAFSSLMLLFFFTYMFISELFKQFNLVTDMITVSIFLWNFGVIGMFCIHWKGPLFLQQVFLIFSCIQMALIFIKYLPEWTTWVLLALISVWDLIAVLCPFGPLRILVETARSRNDQLFPAMVYSSTILYTIMAGLGDEQTETRNETVALETTDTNQNRNQAVVADEDDGGFNDPANHLPKKKRTTNNESNVRNNVHHNQLPVNTSNIQEELVQQQDDEESNIF
jgi:presenilin 1